MSIRQNIVALIEREGLNQEAFARRLGVSQPAVSGWVNGTKNPSMSTVKRICEAFGVTEGDILSDGHGVYVQLHGNVVGAGALVPMLGATHMGEAADEEERDRFVEVPASVAKAHPKAFCVHADGGCMDNRYPDDCVLLVDPSMEPFNGCAVLAEMEGYRSVVRVYMRGTGTLLLAADSHSGEYEDIIVGPDDPPVTLKGVVVWYQAEDDVKGL